MADYKEKYCRYCNHYKPAAEFVKRLDKGGKVIGHSCWDCEEGRKRVDEANKQKGANHGSK